MTANPCENSGILLVDDEPPVLHAMSTALELRGFYDIRILSNPKELFALPSSHKLPVVLLDLNMGEHDGRDLLPELMERFPDLIVIIVTGLADVATAVQCVRAGAFDFLTKPVNPDQLAVSVRRAMEFRSLRQENRKLNQTMLSPDPTTPPAFAPILTQDPALLQVIHYANLIAQTSHSVLITGETGVGKELFAHAIHQACNRSGKFVTVNTAGLDDQLFADTIFGHRKGAFTGADRDHAGLIEQAEGGTLFLDEIGDLSLQSQVKLLRLLQEGEYYPLGSERPRHTNARMIFATNRVPEDLQNTPSFRKDLYYRISTHRIQIPPLRARKGDLPLLTGHFVQEISHELGRTPPKLNSEFLSALAAYDFPGNIRELKATITDILSRGNALDRTSITMTLGVHPEGNAPAEQQFPPQPAQATSEQGLLFGDVLPSLKEAEWLLVEEALRRCGNCQTKAARLLGISQQAISKRIQQKKTSSFAEA